MVKIEPITPPQPPTKLEFLENLKQYINSASNDTWYINGSYYYSEKSALLAEYNYEPTLADLETSPDLLEWFEEFQSEEQRKRVSSTIFEKHFNGDWRSGQEVQKAVITQRLYQTSPNSTQE